MTAELSGVCQRLLARQRGVLARWQVAEFGTDSSLIRNRLRFGRWQPLYRGVFCEYTGEPRRDSLLWAAVVRCGPEAVLSHYTAAELDGIPGRRTEAIHVTVPSRQKVAFASGEFARALPRIVVHRSGRLAESRHPVKSPPRTRVEDTVVDLVELARDLDDVFSWLSAACAGGHTTPGRLASAVACRPKLRWRADVLVGLAEVASGVHTVLERRYVQGVERAHGLPRADRQVRTRRDTRSAYLDNLYQDYGLIVELDGLAYHLVQDRWQDIHRDNYFARSDILVLRYNWADITVRPCQVAAEVAAALRKRGWPGGKRSRCALCHTAAA
jgi:very-short-patch-repair endonuclease